MLAPSSSGPSVTAAQYTSTRCAMGRGVRTRQIAFSVRSIVSIIAIAVNTSTTRPAVPSRVALLANWVSADSTGLAIVGGTSDCRKYFSTLPWNVENIGNAAKMASITVTSGTSEMRVVKVRLLAVMPRRSSRKRWRSVFSVSSQGQLCSVCTSRAT